MWSAQTKTQRMNLAESDLSIMYALKAARRHKLALLSEDQNNNWTRRRQIFIAIFPYLLDREAEH